ncbi:hypothetical protein F8M41_023862 [Gigaspora margarita]|uniref:Uncharacterized protein n=1 Tax=Gigaspora margarita TaxID=4874 RepID=A0A8H4B0N2_GIGMA|nr:hypothetical protein F8M41_023862 [Gigaspora margarita]
MEDIAVSILNNDDNDNNISTPVLISVSCFSPSIEYNTNTNIPTIVIQEKMVIIRILFVEFNDDNDNNISTPDDSQSHSDSNKSQNEKSDSIIFDTPSDRFKALPLSNKVRLWIAYVCNTGSLLIEIAVILYDFIELALDRNVFE